MFMYLSIFKMQYIIYRPNFYNFVTRKISEMVQTIQIEVSTNSNTARPQIYIHAYVTKHLPGMFYDSKTQLIQFTN